MNEPNQAEFEQLLNRYLDGGLSSEEGARFAELLKQDPANARAFAQASVLHQQVRSMLKFERSVGAPIECEQGSSALRWPWLAGAVLFGVLFAVAMFWWIYGQKDRFLVADTGAEAKRLDVPSIHILSGTTKLLLPKIGHVIVDGPAKFDMLDPMRARLSEGRARVHVTEKTGYGFVVETPHGKVTDLGTEFGLNVPREGKVGLVVFDGTVDLEVNDLGDAAANGVRVSRLVRGEGVTFDKEGQLDRINSIVTGAVATFLPLEDIGETGEPSLIVSVHDNLQADDTKKFYEIVPGGFGEDMLSYVDRPHEWNGIKIDGIPSELIGSDYVKTFADDDMRTDTKIYVAVSRPAKFYVLYDDQLQPPRWLKKDFRKIEGKVGMDLDAWPEIGRVVGRGEGPGNSIDHQFDIWERIVKKPGMVTFGANARLAVNGKPSKAPYMYGILAKPLDAVDSKDREQ